MVILRNEKQVLYWSKVQSQLNGNLEYTVQGQINGSKTH